MDLALPAATGSVSPAPAKAIPAAAATASQSAGPGAAAAKRPIADLIRVFVGNGSAANPNAGLLFGNGFSYDASTCAGTSTCDGGRGGFLVGNGGDGWNGGSGGSAGLFGSGGAGGAAVSGVPGAWGGFGGRGGLLWGKRGPDGANEWSSWVFDPYPDPLIQEGDGSASGGVEPQPEAGAPGDGGSPADTPIVVNPQPVGYIDPYAGWTKPGNLVIPAGGGPPVVAVGFAPPGAPVVTAGGGLVIPAGPPIG